MNQSNDIHILKTHLLKDKGKVNYVSGNWERLTQISFCKPVYRLNYACDNYTSQPVKSEHLVADAAPCMHTNVAPDLIANLPEMGSQTNE